jgi:hypothetical protein
LLAILRATTWHSGRITVSMKRQSKGDITMATSSTEIERIVRKLLNEEQGETVDAIRELSTLLTEQVIPRLSKGDEDLPEADDDDDDDQDDVESDEGDVMSMSAFGDEDVPRGAGRKSKPNGANGHDEDQDATPPEHEIPTAVMDAFATLYSTLSSEQVSAFTELFTVIDSELDGAGDADETHDEDEVRVRA